MRSNLRGMLGETFATLGVSLGYLSNLFKEGADKFSFEKLIIFTFFGLFRLPTPVPPVLQSKSAVLPPSRIYS
jgi:hypothetical protein